MSSSRDAADHQVPPKAAGSFRVIHTGDWHLGKCLAEQTRDAEHEAFLSWLREAMRAHQVDALIIAGDVFDTANPPQRAVSQYYDFLHGIYCAGTCAVIVTAGNHDSPGHLDAPRQVLQALRTHIIGARPEQAEEMLIPLPNAEDPRLIVAAVPFLRDRDLRTAQAGLDRSSIQAALVAGVKRTYTEVAEAAAAWRERGVPLLATGHLTVTGATHTDSERDIHVGGLGAVSGNAFPACFSYVALGHFHRPQQAGGEARIRYAGSPIPLSFSEAGDRKEVRVVDLAADGLRGDYSLPIPVHRRLLRVEVQRLTLEEELAALAVEESPLPAWLEVTVRGATPGEDVYEMVRGCVAERDDLEVLQVLRPQREGAVSLDELTPDEAIDDVLGDPREVFRRRLELQEGLDDDRREALRTAFDELCDLLAESRREEGPS